MKRPRVPLLGSVALGILSSACCIGPLVFATLGIAGAAAAQRLEPLRPYLLLATYALLAAAFYSTYRPAQPECGPGEACEIPAANRAAKAALWVATLFVLLTTTFPVYSIYLF
ncbi:MAG: mercuric transport protein [Vicinamibacteria bacterium]|jgi:mercuric ion transport protein|nr:mercuric transport protein [Vicinamibacteria bacterium]MBP9944882.1 mercuric transport protein [Vicinamibacteria bacterium]